jgi:hypothetical protein
VADEFYLAEKLHMSVARLREEISEAEFVDWLAYFRVKAQAAELEQKNAAAKMGR